MEDIKIAAKLTLQNLKSLLNILLKKSFWKLLLLLLILSIFPVFISYIITKIVSGKIGCFIAIIAFLFLAVAGIIFEYHILEIWSKKDKQK